MQAAVVTLEEYIIGSPEDRKKNDKDRLIKKYPLESIGIFGSFSRNEQTQDNDVDILVEFDQPIGIEFIDLAEELEVIK